MSTQRKTHFDHERLEVYQHSLAFVAWITPILEGLSRAGDVRDQIDRASTSIPLNIAEGNGKYSRRDRCRYIDSAIGSSFECAAALDVLVSKKKLEIPQIDEGKELLSGIVRMLYGWAQSMQVRDYHRRNGEE